MVICWGKTYRKSNRVLAKEGLLKKPEIPKQTKQDKPKKKTLEKLKAKEEKLKAKEEMEKAVENVPDAQDQEAKSEAKPAEAATPPAEEAKSEAKPAEVAILLQQKRLSQKQNLPRLASSSSRRS